MVPGCDYAAGKYVELLRQCEKSEKYCGDFSTSLGNVGNWNTIEQFNLHISQITRAMFKISKTAWVPQYVSIVPHWTP